MTGTAITSKQKSTQATVYSVQAWRGIAALLVVVHHTLSMWNILPHRPSIHASYFDGSRGVDIFFILSGFIMPLSIRRGGSGPRSAGTFLIRRLERIVPMYWICTTFRVLTPNQAEIGRTPWHIFASYFFLPSFNGLHEIVPALPPGWTLNLEMAFYSLIAVALLLDLPLRVLLPPSLVLLSLTSLLPMPHTVPIDASRMPLFVEFLLGLVLAVRFRNLNAGARAVPVFLAAAGSVLCFVLLITHALSDRTPVQALLAMGAVGFGLEVEREIGKKIPRLLLLLGDASYSIYLTHWFVVGAVHQVLLHRFPSATFLLVLPVAIAISCVVGIVAYRYIESPINRWFKVKRSTAVPA